MRTITLYTFGILDSADTCRVAPFPTVFILWYAGVHVSTMNCGNESSYIESSVDEALGLGPTLSVPDVNLNYWHVQFRGHFDDSGFWCQHNIVEDMVALQNFFDVIRDNMRVSVFG